MNYRPIYEVFKDTYIKEENDEERKEDIKLLIEIASNYKTIGEFLTKYLNIN